jgi:uncharacterized protein YuzE
MHSLELVDKLFRVDVAAGPLGGLGENVAVDVTLKGNVIGRFAREILTARLEITLPNLRALRGVA